MFHNYPYTDFHELNLDWFLSKFKEMLDEWNGISGNLKNWLIEQLNDWLDDGTITGHLNNLVIVNDYGARGDGINDDTAAIQKCIDDNPGSLICFKKGTYIITDTITLWGASGGQYILLGGSTIKWRGASSVTVPMLLVEKDYDPVLSSMCRIVGGNIDGNNLAGIGIQNKAFYTDICGCKIFDFTSYGILNGTLDNNIEKSTQAKIHDLHIFMTDSNAWSAENRIAIKLTYPDNQLSNVITNRCKYAYELVSGGNSFSNCHSTVQYNSDYNLTANTLIGGHILLNPKNSGIIQENLFTNCYFNVGKYVVHNPDIATSLVTHIDNSHFTYYTSSNLNFTLESYLWYGHYGTLKTNNFDIVVGANCNFRDYFISEGTPTAAGIPDMHFNTTTRHPEADICVANNYMSNLSGAHLIAGNGISVPKANTYYEVGGILFTYIDSDNFTRIYSEPIKVEYEVEYTHCEAIISINGDNNINVNTTCCKTPVDVHRLYIGSLTNKIVGGKSYKYLPVYIYCTDFLNLRLFLKLSSLGTNNKCYVVNSISDQHMISGTPAATRLFAESLENVPDLFYVNGNKVPTDYLTQLSVKYINSGTSRTMTYYGHMSMITIKRGSTGAVLLTDEFANNYTLIGGTLGSDVTVEVNGKNITITNNTAHAIYVTGVY